MSLINIDADNINDAFRIGLIYFRQFLADGSLHKTGGRGQTRLEYPFPMATTYRYPRQRVLFDPVRDANPFFHLMESLWIIEGREDVEWLKQWLPSIANYSDDGHVFHGAYGARIHRGGQLERVIHRLQQEPDGNRAVLSIYDGPDRDASYTGKDMPCNCTVFLSRRNEKLNITVCNRSNDLIWGTYGANVVQFSMLQEYIAARVGLSMGWYVQFSNNTHIYPENGATQRVLDASSVVIDPYHSVEQMVAFAGQGWGMQMKSSPLVVSPARWYSDLRRFMFGDTSPALYTEPFFHGVALPMQAAHHEYRIGELENAIAIAWSISAMDWRFACARWLERRLAARKAKEPA